MQKFTHLLTAVFISTGMAHAADLELPKEIRLTEYANVPIVHNQFLAIEQALVDATGADLVEMPAWTDRERMELLVEGTVDFSAAGVGGSIVAQEGVLQFGGKDWGPQKVRLALANTDEPINYGVAVADDLGVETYADLKGKRVAWYTNYPVVNENTEAFLAYGGLTWDDVEKVEFDGFFSEALKALGEGKVDAVFADTIEDVAYTDALGPRGIFWPTIASEDDEAFKRLLAVAPYFVHHHVDKGAGVDPATGHQGANYPYPVLVVLENTDSKLVYNMTKAIVELYPRYQGKAFGIDGWKLNKNELRWFVPYHEGAIAYFKELGIWTDAIKAHNDHLVARQEALADAWAALKAENPDDWAKAWTERRYQTLRDGGFQVIF